MKFSNAGVNFLFFSENPKTCFDENKLFIFYFFFLFML